MVITLSNTEGAMLCTCSFKYRMAKRLSVYPPNASRLKKFPHLPMICPNNKLGAAVSATSQKLSFFFTSIANETLVIFAA